MPFNNETVQHLTLEESVYQAVGAASTCWESMEGTGIFQDDQAREIASTLMGKIRQETAGEQWGLVVMGDGDDSSLAAHLVFWDEDSFVRYAQENPNTIVMEIGVVVP